MINEILTPDLKNRISVINWKNRDYSDEKAYVCCELAALAYYSIPEYELKNKRRIKVIPCQSYKDKIESRKDLDFTTLIKGNESEQIFTVHRRYAVVVGVRFTDVIFISIRGTTNLYDWAINLNARKCRVGVSGEKYHLGFFRAIAACTEEINEKLREWQDIRDIPIYITGHSLGGAMAGIFYRKWNRFMSFEDDIDFFWEHPRVFATAAYTFGMPRYGNMAAVIKRSPFHLYNEGDIVPCVPPRFMGFEDSINQKELTKNSIESRTRFGFVKHLFWSFLLFAKRSIESHSMETYRKGIRKLISGEGQL